MEGRCKPTVRHFVWPSAFIAKFSIQSLIENKTTADKITKKTRNCRVIKANDINNKGRKMQTSASAPGISLIRISHLGVTLAILSRAITATSQVWKEGTWIWGEKETINEKGRPARAVDHTWLTGKKGRAARDPFLIAVSAQVIIASPLFGCHDKYASSLQSLLEI